jgi:hypothetical protein
MSSAAFHSIAIELGEVPRVLSPNARPNRFAKAKAKAFLRRKAGTLAISASGMSYPLLLDACACFIVWRVAGHARPDEDNAKASLKAAFDGLQDARALIDDRHLKTWDAVLVTRSREPGVTLVLAGWKKAKAGPGTS